MKYKKAAKTLNLLNKSAGRQKLGTTVRKAATSAINTVAETLSKYPITECFQLLKNMYTKPTYEELCITTKAWMKLNAFIHLVGDFEISGFGRIQKGEVDGKEMHLVTDFDIIKQEVKAAYVESDEDAVMEFIMNTPADQRGEWVLDWHSHVNMATSPSGTDWTNYSDMLKARMNQQFPAMIVNKKGDVTAYQIITDGRHTPIKMYIDTSPISDDELWALYQECKEKVETRCSKAIAKSAATTSTVWTGGNYRNNNVGYTGSTLNSYDDYDYNYGYGYGYGYGNRWWDYEDEEVIEAKKQGYVFDDDKSTGNDTIEVEAVPVCEECGKPLNTPNEISWGVCQECFDEALKKQAK